jgi:hypothetical protein
MTTACLLTLCGAGCAKQRMSEFDADSKAVGFVRGQARVLSVDERLGLAVLEIDGQRVPAYWQKEVARAEGGAKVQDSPIRPPVGVYREPTVRPVTFPAQVGDVIAYVGLRTGNDLLLRGVQVIGR